MLEKTTHAIIEDSEEMSKANNPSKGRRSEGNINSVRRLVSTSSSTSSQSLTNCQYVSVVVTNEQTAINRENFITCHENTLTQTAHDNDIPHAEISKIADEVDNLNELTQNHLNDIDIPSNPKHPSGNHGELNSQEVIINKDRDSDTEIIIKDNAAIQNQEESVNVEPSDAVAFTDESCTQYIDSEDSINSEEN